MSNPVTQSMSRWQGCSGTDYDFSIHSCKPVDYGSIPHGPGIFIFAGTNEATSYRFAIFIGKCNSLRACLYDHKQWGWLCTRTWGVRYSHLSGPQ